MSISGWHTEFQRVNMSAFLRRSIVRWSVVSLRPLLIAATLISDFLRQFDPGPFSHALQDDPLAFIRLLNALSRLTWQGIQYERWREAGAKRKARNQRWQATLKDAGILP